MFIIHRIKNRVDRKAYIEFFTIEQASEWAKRHYMQIPDEEINTEIEGYCGYVFNRIK